MEESQSREFSFRPTRIATWPKLLRLLEPADRCLNACLDGHVAEAPHRFRAVGQPCVTARLQLAAEDGADQAAIESARDSLLGSESLAGDQCEEKRGGYFPSSHDQLNRVHARTSKHPQPKGANESETEHGAQHAKQDSR